MTDTTKTLSRVGVFGTVVSHQPVKLVLPSKSNIVKPIVEPTPTPPAPQKTKENVPKSKGVAPLEEELQTPRELAKALISKIPLQNGDVVYEPFKGQGSFYDQFPDFVHKDWSEILEGRNFIDYKKPVDWVISFPPFKMEMLKGNDSVFFRILLHFASEDRVRKGICLLASKDSYLSVTPKRMALLNTKGWYLSKQVVCNVNAHRGRMVFMMFSRKQKKIVFEQPVFDYILKYF